MTTLPMIRKYEDTDHDAVIAIFRSNIPKYFSTHEEDGLHNFLSESNRTDDYVVCEIDGEVVGAGGIALNDDDTVSLCWGMVRSDHIGTGLGKVLTEFRINAAREKFSGLPIVIGTSQHTKGFYEKFGFRMTLHKPDGYGPGIDSCRMRLD